MLGLADSFVQWVCGFLREGFLADFSPVLSISEATWFGSRRLHPDRSSVKELTVKLFHLLFSELYSFLLKLGFFAKRQKLNKLLFLAYCLFREPRMLAST